MQSHVIGSGSGGPKRQGRLFILRFVLKGQTFPTFFLGTVLSEILSVGKHEEALDIVPILSACQVQFHVFLPSFFLLLFCTGFLPRWFSAGGDSSESGSEPVAVRRPSAQHLPSQTHQQN